MALAELALVLACLLISLGRATPWNHLLLGSITVAGLAVQIGNAWVDHWQSRSIASVFVGSVILVVGAESFLYRHGKKQLGPLAGRTSRIAIRRAVISSFALAMIFGLIVLLLQRGVTFTLVHAVRGEDNAKWLNASYELLNGKISATNINGVGGGLVIILLIVLEFLRAISSVSGVNATGSELILWTSTLSFLFVAALVISTIVTLSKKNLSTERISRPISKCAHQWLRSGTAVITVGIVLVSTFDKGFLTFATALLFLIFAGALTVEFQSLRESQTGVQIPVYHVVIAICSVLVAGMVWLPLIVVAIPIAISIVLWAILKITGPYKYMTAGILTVIIPFVYVYLIRDRIRYFFSTGSSGESMWSELFKTGGATPSVDGQLLIMGALSITISYYAMSRQNRQGFSVFCSYMMMWVVIFVVIGGVVATPNSYAVTKISLFVFTLIVAIGSLLTHRLWDEPKNLATSILQLAFYFTLVFSGHVSQVATTIENHLSVVHSDGTSQPWLAETRTRLESGDEIPVGCVSIDTQSMSLSAPTPQQYSCTRFLSNLVGGEERLIGLLAFSQSNFTIKEMIGSLEHYLGPNQSELVYVLDKDSMEVRDIIEIQNIKSLVPKGYDGL